MEIIQEAFEVSEEIAIGLVTGKYKRNGGVVRDAVTGHIVKHLDPVDLEQVATQTAERAQSVGRKALRCVQQNKKEFGIAAIGITVTGVCLWGYRKWRTREPKVLKEFRASLNTYIEAIRNGNMTLEVINTLMISLETLKSHKDYENISIQLTADQLDVIVNRIHEYTIKLAKDNAVELSEDELETDSTTIINLQSYLLAQRRVFEAAA